MSNHREMRLDRVPFSANLLAEDYFPQKLLTVLYLEIFLEGDNSRVGINKDEHLFRVSSKGILYAYELHAGVETTGARLEPFHGETAL